MKLRNIIIVAVAVGLLGLLAFRFVTSGTGEKIPSTEDIRRAEGIPVDVFNIAAGEFENWLEKSGNLEGIEQAPIYANMPARVRSVRVRQGRQVKAGQVIIVLDPLSATQTYSAREGARLRYETLKREYERLQPLHEAGAISDSQLDQAKLMLQSARAALRDVSASLTLHTPIGGTVTDVRVRAGEKVEPGETLAVIAKIDKARLEIEVSSRDVKLIATGQPAVVAENGNGETASGSVCCVSLSADPKTRLFLVEVILDSQGSLPPGTLQRVKIRIHHEHNAILVPNLALIASPGKMEVFVVTKDKTATKRAIEIGSQNEKFSVVKSGLQEGDQVIVWGANLLAGGEKVQIHKVVEQI